MESFHGGSWVVLAARRTGFPGLGTGFQVLRDSTVENPLYFRFKTTLGSVPIEFSSVRFEIRGISPAHGLIEWTWWVGVRWAGSWQNAGRTSGWGHLRDVGAEMLPPPLDCSTLFGSCIIFRCFRCVWSTSLVNTGPVGFLPAQTIPGCSFGTISGATTA